jgi:hypothetical protein
MKSVITGIRDPKGLIQGMTRIKRILEIANEAGCLEIYARFFLQAMSVSMKIYFDALALKMRSDDWQARFGRPAHGRFRSAERAVEALMLTAAFVQVACDLLYHFIKSGIFSDSETRSLLVIDDWINTSPAGKNASEQLHEAINRLVTNPIKVQLVEAQGKENVVDAFYNFSGFFNCTAEETTSGAVPSVRENSRVLHDSKG